MASAHKPELPPVRPKAYRRPLGLEPMDDALHLKGQKTAVHNKTSSAPEIRQLQNIPARLSHNRYFGLHLIVFLIAINLLLALVLRNVDSTQHSANAIDRAEQKVTRRAPEIRVYSTPEPIRRTATYLSLDSAADSTDTMVKQMPVPPPTVELE